MRKLLGIAAVNAGLLLAAAVIAELVFGTWFSKDPLDELGLPRDQNMTVSVASLYPGGGDVVYRRDHWGFRGPGVDPAQVTILTVGGSTTSQLYLPEDATWQSVMARELAAAGDPVVVANAGIDDQGTVGHLRAMTEWFSHVPGLKPRFVLLYVGLNDVHTDGSAAGHLRQASGATWLRQHSALWQAGAKALDAIQSRHTWPVHQPVDYAAARWTDTALKPDWQAEGRRSLDAYCDRLRALAEAAHGMGAVPVFITQTRGDFKVEDGRVLGMVEDGELNGVDHYLRLAAVNAATRKVCAEQGLLCLDLAREVAFEPADYYDHLHNTPQGAEKIGRWLAAKLAGLV